MYAPQMRSALDRIMPEIDLVHTQGPFVYPSYAAARAAMRHRKPLLYSQRGCLDAEHLRFRAVKKKLYIAAVEKPIMRYAHALVALTDAERAAYRALGVSTPISIVPNGVHVPAPRPEAAERVRERFGIAPDAQMILFLGRLHPTKGADKLLDAFGCIMNDFPRAVLMIAGPDEWGLREQWRARCVPAHRVIFPGMVGGEEKADILWRADLFCLPSFAEGFSIAVLEAMASATAVMLSPECHFPEVESAKAGLVVDPDVAQIAPAMRTLLADPARLGAMGQAGRRLVSDHYSWDIVTDQLIELYRQAVAAKP
jgi:glycosyltransferase involved in cell wall biosynthesis